MKLETAGALSIDNATPQDIEQAFEDEAHRGEYVQLIAEDGRSFQASDDGEGMFILQYVDDSGQIVSTGEEVSASEAKAALIDYVQGGSAWKESREWIEEKPSTGCLPVILLALTLPVFLAVKWLSG